MYRIAEDQLASTYAEEFKNIPMLNEALAMWKESIISKEAADMSYKSNTLGDAVSEQQFRVYGGTSQHRYVTVKEADEAVKTSNGFLYAKKVEGRNDIVELRPTIPEFVQDKEDPKKKIALRKTIKAVFRTMIYMLYDENGKLSTETKTYEHEGDVKTYGEMFDLLINRGTQDREKRRTETFMVDVFYPAMTRMLEEDYVKKGMSKKKAADKADEDAFDLCKSYIKILDYGTGSLAQSPDVSLDVYHVYANTVREATTDDILKDERFKDLKIDGVPVTAAEVEEAMAEVKKQSEATDQEMLKLRNIDIDSEEMFTFGSCIDNSVFLGNLYKTFIDVNGGDFIEHKYSHHATKEPQKFIDDVRKNLDHIALGADLNEKEKESVVNNLNDAEEGLKKNGKLNMNDEGKITNVISFGGSKYELHYAQPVSVVGANTYTVESFGSVYDQVIKSPITFNASIGKYTSANGTYKNHNDSMERYYMKDDPYSYSRTRKKIIMSRITHVLRNKAVKAQNDRDNALGI